MPSPGSAPEPDPTAPATGPAAGPAAGPATIGTVAQAAGVSRATVSRAFGQPHRLRPETVERVRAVASELGYTPNPVAQALSTGRSGNLALVVPDIANPFFPPMIRAVQGQAERAGYAVFLGDADEDPNREDVLLTRLARQVDGFVLASSRMSAARIREQAERRPLVLVNRDVAGIPRVLIDTAGGVARAVERLAELGHRRIAYLNGPARSWSNTQRLKAVRAAGARFDVAVVPLPARRPTFEAGRQAVPELLGSGARAVVAFDDLVGHGVLAGLGERGLSVPADFSVVGCDDVLAAQAYPPLTTVSARSAEAGTAAVELLAARLAGTSTGDVRLTLETALVPGATVAAPPRRADRQ